jgi:high-affinity iron transporter
MLVLTGTLLGIVLLVMVGEQAQEMQQAGWIPTTVISWLEHVIPDWMGMWFSIFPTVQSLVAQLVAAVLVLGSYVVARWRAGAGSSRPGGPLALRAVSTSTAVEGRQHDSR